MLILPTNQKTKASFFKHKKTPSNSKGQVLKDDCLLFMALDDVSHALMKKLTLVCLYMSKMRYQMGVNL